MQRFILKRLLTGVFALCLALAATVYGQGITTAAMSGFVSDQQGKPISGATVTVVHEPSGTKSVTTSRSNGQFNLSGLRVGGPYTVTTSGTGYRGETRNDVYLDLGASQDISFALASETVVMEAFKVEANQDMTFDTGKIGTGTSYNSAQINDTASVRRNVQDIASLDSRLALQSLDQGGNLSAQGQNFRFNSFLVDGVQANDPYGLNGNGFSSLRSPVPLDAIQSLSVELNPYDVRRAGFTGALLNAVTKSGGNEFHGSARMEYTGQNWRGGNPITGTHEKFQEHTFDYTLSGPIIKNRLFFFLNYDEFKRTSDAPQANLVFTDQSEIDAVVARAKALGYDPGPMTASNTSKQRTTLGKLDWNISDSQRLSFTYRRNHGEDTNFASYTAATTTSFSNYWFQQPRNTNSSTAQLFSSWTPNFRTEATYSFTQYDGSPINHGTPFPEVTVQGLHAIRLDTGVPTTSTSLRLGTEFSRQLNFINTKENNATFNGEYSFGDHVLTFGAESDQTKYANLFAQAVNGSYTFTSVANWVAGTPISSYTDATPFPGRSVSDAFAIWKYTAYGAFVQDTWKPNQQLTLLGGLRLDYPYIGQKPPLNPAFQAAFGFRNDTTNSGNYTVGPRLGFIYQMKSDRKTQFRGGIGLFQGKNPAVWISNAYSNAGALGTVNQSNPAGLVFQPDVTKQPVPAGTVPAPNINITDPDFVQPLIWKSNIAVDHTLPFGGWIVSAELTYNKVQKSPNVLFLNYKSGTSANGSTLLPDGREHYAGTITSNLTGSPSTSTTGRRNIPAFADVFSMVNTKNGYSQDVTLALNRPMKNNWAASISWTHTHATEVSPMTSSVASSNYSGRASFNPNEDVASLSNTNLEHRVVATLTRQFEFIKGAPTTFSFVYQGRTGHPYSWIFNGDANGDGFTFNDLLYVPTGPNDPKVIWTVPAERDAFFAFVNSTDLKNYMGGHAPRNSETSPWTNTLDLKFSQEIRMPYYNQVRADFYLNFLNFGNFLNKKWGQLEEVPFSYKRQVAGATYDPNGNGGAGAWIYAFNGGTLAGVPTVANDQPVSRWQIQGGIEIQF